MDMKIKMPYILSEGIFLESPRHSSSFWLIFLVAIKLTAWITEASVDEGLNQCRERRD